MIFTSRSGFSYRHRRTHQKKRFRLFLVIGFIFVLFQGFFAFVVEPYQIKGLSLEPFYPHGSHFLLHRYHLKDKQGILKNSPQRGELVAVRPPYVPPLPWFIESINVLLRFFTLQKVALDAQGHKTYGDALVFKRIIGLPGDTVKMEDSVAYIKNHHTPYFISEFESSNKNYDIQARLLPEGWTDELPFSGYQESKLLGPQEYFLLSDNRAATNDSRYWGALSRNNIRGRLVFAYWPLSAIGPIR